MIFKATLIQKTVLVDNCIRFHFALKLDQRLVFEPGQYLMAEVVDIRRRPYSIESASQDGKTFTLLIDISPQGIGSKFFESLSVDNEIEMQGPFGLNVLQVARSYLFIATGVGISPFMPMFAKLADNQFLGQVTLVQGAKSATDLLNVEALSVIQSKLKNFEWIKALSQEKFSGTFPGRVNEWITQHYEPHAHELVYLCGGPEMVRNCRTALLQKNSDPMQLKIEVFS